MSTVLLIDDNPGDVRLFSKAIEEVHPTVSIESAASSREAMARLGRGPRPDLVLLDLGLPDVRGHELLRQLRREGWSAPIVVLTSSDSPRDQRESQALDVPHFTKPVSYRTLRDLASHLSDAYLVRREGSQ